MKRNPSSDSEPDVVDKIVEDLAQQDVLPVDAESEAPMGTETVMNAEEQAGSWDDVAGGKGHQMARTPLEDESASAEELVQRGVDEADEELEELDEQENPSDETE